MAINMEVNAALMRLIADYNDRIPAGSILRCLSRALHELRAAGVNAGVVIAAEAMARQRLELRLNESAGVP